MQSCRKTESFQIVQAASWLQSGGKNDIKIEQWHLLAWFKQNSVYTLSMHILNFHSNEQFK